MSVSQTRAERAWVVAESGERALMMRWSDPACAARAARVLGDETLGGQLFALPELLEADVEAGWVRVTAPAGEPCDLASFLALHERAPHQAHALITSLGALLRKLHSVSSPGYFGHIQPPGAELLELGAGAHHTFNGWVVAQLERAGAALAQASQLDEAQRMALRESLGDLRHELSAFHPRHAASLCHGELGLEHVWVGASGEEAVALTGFGVACFAPPESDLARLVWLGGLAERDESLVRALYRGYGAARTMDAQRRERFYRRLAALDALSEVLAAGLDDQAAITRTIALAGPHINPFLL